MMHKQAHQLARRKQALLVKIQAQRQLFSLQKSELSGSLNLAAAGQRLGINLFGRAKQHPLLTATLAAGLVWLRPRRVLSIAKTALQAWMIWREINPSNSASSKDVASP
ncbi:YqjK family protein [Undibacterium rugosum]|uniref:YqjK-like protein n=1 Tax=Undibacterium rugosum TaxID=2762291 RepID=A0A923I311_9BURK|nr:YqjK family protein [Undibacterium rugosum]MBC3935109.1 hypothetical protein [Undibacterium rugosum]MBR7780044.1 hypothetical protein [Undibacterium rugosum]